MADIEMPNALSARQRRDIESISFFIPTTMRHIPIGGADVDVFLALSERGAGKRRDKFAYGAGADALAQGKRWREWHMRAWEEGILEGTMPLIDIVEGLPRVVIDYTKRSLFGGKMAETIERLYAGEQSA